VASGGSQLFGDLIEHWERRSVKALERMHPDKLDRAKLMSVQGYGDSLRNSSPRLEGSERECLPSRC
jgi:hypothetical protein